MPFWAQAYSNACAQTGSPRSSASVMSSAAEQVSWRGKVATVVGQDDVDAIRHGLDQRPQEVSGDPARGLLMQLDEGKLCGAIDGN